MGQLPHSLPSVCAAYCLPRSRNSYVGFSENKLLVSGKGENRVRVCSPASVTDIYSPWVFLRPLRLPCLGLPWWLLVLCICLKDCRLYHSGFPALEAGSCCCVHSHGFSCHPYAENHRTGISHSSQSILSASTPLASLLLLLSPPQQGCPGPPNHPR